jgi:hypothetical protein
MRQRDLKRQRDSGVCGSAEGSGVLFRTALAFFDIREPHVIFTQRTGE